MIETWSEGIADENMPEGILVELADLIRRHPWWIARASLTFALLENLRIHPPARILDAGCGWGVTLERLETRGYQVTGLDLSRRALERIDRPDRRLIQADLSQTPPDDVEPFDAVLALDVIEHLDDDRGTVARFGQLVRPGGVVVVSVPAQPELFTEFDAIQGHRRRYDVKTLRAAFEGSNLDVERTFWWGAWMVPVLKRQRRQVRARDGRPTFEVYRDYLRLPPWPLPWALRLAYKLEQNRSLRNRLKTGTSLFAIARRPTQDE